MTLTDRLVGAGIAGIAVGAFFFGLAASPAIGFGVFFVGMGLGAFILAVKNRD